MKKKEIYAETPALAKWISLMLRCPQLVRWIQWDYNNFTTGHHLNAEEKAEIIDSLVKDFFSNPSSENGFQYWTEIINSEKKYEIIKTMDWVRSKTTFQLLTKDSSESSSLKNALMCNVW